MIGAIGDVVYIDKIIKAIKNYLKKFQRIIKKNNFIFLNLFFYQIFYKIIKSFKLLIFLIPSNFLLNIFFLIFYLINFFIIFN